MSEWTWEDTNMKGTKQTNKIKPTNKECFLVLIILLTHNLFIAYFLLFNINDTDISRWGDWVLPLVRT